MKELKAAILEKTRKEGPQFLTINRDGTASITPYKGEATVPVQEFVDKNKNTQAPLLKTQDCITSTSRGMRLK